jgi:hypothetical protein
MPHKPFIPAHSHDSRPQIHKLFSELRLALDDARLMEYDDDDLLYRLLSEAENLVTYRDPSDDRRNA